MSILFSARRLVFDCGASRTSLGIFHGQGGRERLERCATHSFAPSAEGEDHWLENTCAAFAVLRDRLKASGPVTLVVPGHALLVKSVKIPRVEAKQREKLIRFEATQALPCALTEVNWASILVDETAADHEVMLAASKTDLLESLFQAAEKAGFEPHAAVPSFVATLAAFRRLHPAPAHPSSLVLNIGARTTTALLVEPRRYAVRTLAIGAGGPVNPTKDGNMGFRTGEESIVQNRLVPEIARTLLHFQWRGTLLKPGCVYLGGGGAQLAGLREALETKLKIPVEPFRPPDFVSRVRAEVHDAPETVSLDLYGALAATGSKIPSTLNLVSAARQSRGRRRGGQRWLVASALMLTTLLIPPLAHFHILRTEMTKKVKAIERVVAPIRESSTWTRGKLHQLEMLKKQVVLLNELTDHRALWTTLFDDLQNRLGGVDQAWLETFQAVPESPGHPLKFAVSGLLLDSRENAQTDSPATIRIKTLLGRLAESPLVAKVESERFDRSQPGVLKFSVVLVSAPRRTL